MTRSVPLFALAAFALCPSIAMAEGAPSAAKPAKPDAKAESKTAAKQDEAKPAAPAAPQPPKPPTELDRLKFLVGNFNCEGSTPVKGAVDHAYKAKWSSKLVLGNFFVGWQYGELKAKDHPLMLAAEGHLSWDGGLKRFLLGWADSAGTATLLRAEAPGEVDQFVFKGTATAAFGRHVPFVYTVTRTPAGFDLLIEGSDTDGQLGKLALIACSGGKGR